MTLPPETRQIPGFSSASDIVRRLKQAGHEAYIVGGGVRDLILGREPKDFDIVTSALPQQTQTLFTRTVPVGIDFGVVIVLHHQHSHEVATFRTDGSYSDGRRPDSVRFATLKEDISRRDFTVNGLVLDPETLEVIDLTGGLGDLQRGVIRTIGDATARFSEDALRLLRAVRFAGRLGFDIEKTTRQALTEAAPTIARVSRERILQELDAMWRHSNRAQTLKELHETGLLVHVLPDVDNLVRHSGDVWRKTLHRVDALADDAAADVVWAAVLADVVCSAECNDRDHDGPLCQTGAGKAEAILADLRASRNTQKEVARIVSRRNFWREAGEMRSGCLLRVVRRDVNGALLDFWCADAAAEGMPEAIDGIAERYSELRDAGRMYDGRESPPLTGADLTASGIAPGPAMGDILVELERLWLEGILTDRTDALEWVHEMMTMREFDLT